MAGFKLKVQSNACSDFTWPPEADAADVYPFNSEQPDSEQLNSERPENARPPQSAAQSISSSISPSISLSIAPSIAPRISPTIPPSRLQSGRGIWSSVGHLALVLVFVASAGATYLGFLAARERRLGEAPVRDAAVLPARSVVVPITFLPAFGVGRPVLSRLTPMAGGSSVERPAASKPARLGEPARQTPPGWISIELPIQLEIYEDGRFVGTNSSDHIALTGGEHQLELVNESLQYRSKQMVYVTPGKVMPIRPTLPSGILHVNALPWGDVFIDGKPAGQTPLGNVKLPIGPHQIVFRHPQLGEQSRTAVVALGVPARVTVDLRK